MDGAKAIDEELQLDMKVIDSDDEANETLEAKASRGLQGGDDI